MRKFVILLLILLSVILFSGAASAHTGMTASSPAENSVAESPVTEIVLEFNTKIEPVSRLTVTNENGEEIPVHEVQVSGTTMTGQLSVPLESGSYTVTWKIIGADGHAVNGSYAFAVQLPESAEPESPAPDASESPAASSPVPPQAENDAGSPSSDISVYLLGAAVLVPVAAIFLSARIRKKRQ